MHWTGSVARTEPPSELRIPEKLYRGEREGGAEARGGNLFDFRGLSFLRKTGDRPLVFQQKLDAEAR
jgi:hypothetical protein